jgi:hypothetical protein
MRFLWILATGAAALALGVSGAIATHAPEVDPATVPTGLLASHKHVTSIRINPFARAVRRHEADVFVQHVRVDAGGALAWHTHPGPALVTVVSGSLGYQRAHHRRCVTTWYPAGTGFMDPGFGHVHRAIAGADAGFDAYVTFVTPTGTPNQTIPRPPPAACS